MSRPKERITIEDRLAQHKRETRLQAALRTAEANKVDKLFKSLEKELSLASKATVHGSKLVSAGICSLLMAGIEAAPEAIGKKIPYAEPASDFIASFIGTNLPSTLHVRLCKAYAYFHRNPAQKAKLEDYIKVLIDRNSNPERQDAKNSEQRIQFQTAKFWSRDETVDYISATLTRTLDSNITKTLLLFAVETFYEPENIVHKAALNISAIVIYKCIQKPAVRFFSPIIGGIIYGVGYCATNVTKIPSMCRRAPRSHRFMPAPRVEMKLLGDSKPDQDNGYRSMA
ncbi:MAG: hypothetical protein P1U34_11845 [Coxiellaceae bacterium]|nr:hypothetical protein [Coxiellaceae bacterium]